MTAEPAQAVCANCNLWQRQRRPASDQSADFIHHRPCKFSMRLDFDGSSFEDNGQVWTSPGSTCFYFAPRVSKTRKASHE